MLIIPKKRFRQLANAFVKKERALLEASGKKSGGGGWFSSWFRSNTLETSGLELTQELMKELYEEIDAEEAKKAKPSSVLPKEVCCSNPPFSGKAHYFYLLTHC